MNWRNDKTDRALNYLGIMRKAGRLELGEMRTVDAVKAGKARLVLLASDAADNARKRAARCLEGRRALLVELPYTKEELSVLLGKGGCSMAAATDFGLAAAFLEALAESEPGRYGQEALEMRRRAEKAAKRRAMGPKSKPGREQHE